MAGDSRDYRYSSYTHFVGGRTFAVWEITEFSGFTMQCWRELVETVTGEVIKTWKPQPHCALAPYDFAKTEEQLKALYESPTYGINASQTVAGSIYSTSGTLTINNSNANGTTTYINTAVAPPPPPAQDEEQDVALRHEFTFPYTGDEIAAALTAKITALTDSITALHSLDETALNLLYNVETDTTAKRTAERRIKELQGKVDKLVAERAPYAKASKQKFDLDLEDVEHFGLNAADAAPRKAVRKPRKPRETQPVEAA